MRITQYSHYAGLDEPETVERIRKERGRIAAYKAASPATRKEVRLSGQAEYRKVLRAARALKITLHCPEGLEELRQLAYEDYARLTVADGRVPHTWQRINEENLDRVTVNYLRHARTAYDKSLRRDKFGTSGLRASYNRVIKARCLDIIAAAYPELAKECDRQRLKASHALEEAAMDLTTVMDAA